MRHLQTCKYSEKFHVSHPVVNPLDINLNLDLTTIEPMTMTEHLNTSIMLVMWAFVASILRTVALFILIKLYL